MQQYINQLPLNKEETKQFRLLYNLFRILKMQNKDIKDIGVGQTKQIEAIALTPTRAGSEARAILEFIRKKDNHINPEVPYNTISLARIAKAKEDPEINERAAELGQNIPNPANNNTLINVYVPESSTNAKVVVISSLGQMMLEKTLTKGEQQLSFGTTEFAGGIYFYTMYVDNKAIATKRMVIVK